MLNSAKIHSLIEFNHAPYWKLFIFRNYGRSLVSSFNCENCAKEAEMPEKIKKSQIALSNALLNFEGETAPFEIDMRTSSTANGSSVFEGIRFKLDSSTNDNDSNLGSIPQFNPASIEGLGYVHRSTLDSALENMRNQNRIDIERERLAWQKDQFERELKEKKAEIKELETKFNSNSKIVENGLLSAISGLISGFVANKVKSDKQDNDSVQGIEDEYQDDQKATAVNKLAELLYSDFSKEQIDKLTNTIKNATVRNKKTEGTSEQAGTTERN